MIFDTIRQKWLKTYSLVLQKIGNTYNLANWTKNLYFYVVFHSWWSKNYTTNKEKFDLEGKHWIRQRIPLETLFGTILIPRWPSLVPRWTEVGPNWPPSWAQVGPEIIRKESEKSMHEKSIEKSCSSKRPCEDGGWGRSNLASSKSNFSLFFMWFLTINDKKPYKK